MDLKQIISNINAAKARLEQVKSSTFYNDEERAKLIDKYDTEIQELEDKKQAVKTAQIEVNNPKIL